MLWWILYRIPLAAYCLILMGMFIAHPTGATVIMIGSAFVMIPWLLFARWVCKRYDKSLKFNNRK